MARLVTSMLVSSIFFDFYDQSAKSSGLKYLKCQVLKCSSTKVPKCPQMTVVPKCSSASGNLVPRCPSALSNQVPLKFL